MLWGIRVDDGDGGSNFLAVSAEMAEQAVGVDQEQNKGVAMLVTL